MRGAARVLNEAQTQAQEDETLKESLHISVDAAGEFPVPVIASSSVSVGEVVHACHEKAIDDALADIAVTELDVPVRARSFDEWWDRTCALAGPLTKILMSVPAETREAMRTRARNAVHAYETANGLELPGVALLASGRSRSGSTAA